MGIATEAVKAYRQEHHRLVLVRVVPGTNVFISAPITRGLAARALKLWQQNRYDLVTSTWQIGELQGVTRRKHLQRHLKPGNVGTLIDALRDRAVALEALPRIDDSPDPDDNHILATAVAGEANHVVTGDKTDLQVLMNKGAGRPHRDGKRVYRSTQLALPEHETVQ